MTAFWRAGFADVAASLTEWRRSLGDKLLQREITLPEASAALEPFEAPWTREVLFGCGEWTAYTNNGLYGGDSSSVPHFLSKAMNVDCYIATHAPRYGPGHAQTSLEIVGPSGEPPLMGIRSITAHAEDGRWSWHLWGRAQPFERTDRYSERLVKNRFDRALLLEYLRAVGIDADNEGFYGPGLLVTKIVDYKRRQLSAQQIRDDLGW